MQILLPLLIRTVPVRGFICGCGHSGTTLIANILAGHPEVYIPLTETEIFLGNRRLLTWRYLRLVLRAARFRKQALLEKTPRHIHKLDLIRKTVPGARFVIPVRDGRDVVASIHRRSGKIERGVTRWIEENRIVLGEQDKPDVLVYRHEDLVADPAATVRRICAFLDLDYRDDLLDFHKRKRLWFRQNELRRGSDRGKPELRVLRNWQVNQPIFDNRGRWQTDLRQQDIAEITEGAGRPLMIAFGYV